MDDGDAEKKVKKQRCGRQPLELFDTEVPALIWWIEITGISHTPFIIGSCRHPPYQIIYGHTHTKKYSVGLITCVRSATSGCTALAPHYDTAASPCVSILFCLWDLLSRCTYIPGILYVINCFEPFVSALLRVSCVVPRAHQLNIWTAIYNTYFSM